MIFHVTCTTVVLRNPSGDYCKNDRRTDAADFNSVFSALAILNCNKMFQFYSRTLLDSLDFRLDYQPQNSWTC